MSKQILLTVMLIIATTINNTIGQTSHISKMISWNELAELSKQDLQDNSCFEKGKFLSWEKITKGEERVLQNIGRLTDNKGKRINRLDEYHPKGTNYYSKNAPIALAYYPYNGCDVFQCNKSKKVYLIYIEYGGHKPERRCRLVRPGLIHW